MGDAAVIQLMGDRSDDGFLRIGERGHINARFAAAKAVAAICGDQKRSCETRFAGYFHAGLLCGGFKALNLDGGHEIYGFVGHNGLKQRGAELGALRNRGHVGFSWEGVVWALAETSAPPHSGRPQCRYLGQNEGAQEVGMGG